MSANSFVGRQDAVSRLLNVLNGEDRSTGKLSILSVEGPGGIGKTFLFDHVLAMSDFSQRNYLTLRVDGQDSVDLFSGLARLVNTASAHAISNKPAGYYFSGVKQVLAQVEQLKRDALSEIKHGSADPDVVEMFGCILNSALAAGKGINDVVPFTKQYLNATQAQKWVEFGLEKCIQGLQALRPQQRWLGGILPDWFGVAQANAVKENAPAVLVDALVTELSAILSGYRSQDYWKPTHGKVTGIDRLLLVIDDYEGLSEQWGEFLVARFLPGLRRVGFDSVVILLGRDQLENTHTNWDQHLKGCLLEKIILKPLAQPEVASLLASCKISDSAEIERAWRDTLGYPYYLQLWLEEVASGGRTFTMLKRFYERTTRWMNQRQKTWLELVVFLDSVNKSTLRRLLCDEKEVEEVYVWFENEGSIRETNALTPCVRQYVRSRLVDYLTSRDPERCQELQQRAQTSNAS